VALALATSLSVAGAHPAAAANLGLLDRLAGLWSVVTGVPSPVSHAVAHRSHGTPAKTTPSSPPPDRGWGIDPNGNSSTSIPVPDPGNG